MKPIGKVLPSLYFFVSYSCFFIVVASISQSTTITHQAHSFDDLGQWRQLIAKGTNFIKVDLRYTLAPLCFKQTRVLNHDNRGCYLLSHDTPLDHQTYYTAYDIVAFVLDPGNAYLFPNTSHLYVYLDFKNNRDRYPPANLTQSNDLQKQYISFFTNQLKYRNITNIELVYDGIYLDELGHSFPWPRTYGFQTSDINVSSSCLYSNLKTCKGTAIINNMANPLPFVDPSLPVLRMCEVKYGKYNASLYPWVFYEPTDQRTVLSLLDTYLDCGIEHAPGFAVSINIDPIQYDIFAGTRSGKAWNQRLFAEAKWAHAIPVSYNDSLLSFVTVYLTKDNQINYTFSQGAFDAVASNGVFPFGEIALTTPRQLQSYVPFAASPFQKLKTFTFSAGGKYYIFVTDFRGNTEVYQVDGLSLVPIANTTFTHKQSESVTYIRSEVMTNNYYHAGNSQIGWIKVEFLQGYVSYMHMACTFYLQWWQLWFDPKGEYHSELLPVGDATCAVHSPFSFPLPVDSAAVSLQPVALNGTANTTYCPNATHAGLLVVSSHKNLHGGVLCVDVLSLEVKVCTDSVCAETQAQLQQQDIVRFPSLSPLDVGTFPSLSTISLPSGDPVVLEVHGDGYCYNSDWNNKRAYPSVCESTPVSSRYVLNYNYGRLQDWASHIFEKKGMITSCDGAIFHGAYDEGSLPSAFLVVDKKNNVRMIEAHSGFPTGAVDYAGCSWPVPYDGAMIDGIILPNISLMRGEKWEPSPSMMQLVTQPNNYDNNVYSPSGEYTIATSICNMCKERLFKWQTKYQSDYELMHSLAYKVSDMCTIGQIIIGDGTIAGCKNLVLLYLPALAVDLARNIFSPDNCLNMGLCTGNASSVLPDLNKQVSRDEYYVEEADLDTREADIHADASARARAPRAEVAADPRTEHASSRKRDNADTHASARRRDNAGETQELMRVIRTAVKTHLIQLLGL